MKYLANIILYFFSFLLLAYSCKEEEELRRFDPEETLYIEEYLEKNQERFGNFLELVEGTAIQAPLLSINPIGNNAYTLFLPNDSAFALFYRENETYSSMEDVLADKEFAGILVRYHLLMSGLSTNEFVYGSLSDTTGTGDELTIGVSTNLESSESYFVVNNTASIIQPNIELSNGYIHVIDHVLDPVIYTGYEWILNNKDFSIFSKLFDLTGLKDQMEMLILNEKGNYEENFYTILAESDDLYSQYGIQNIDDLIAFIDPEDENFTEENNAVYQFAGYHVLKGSLFINELESGIYSTLSNLPIGIDSELEIRINPGIHGDSTYIPLVLEESNLITKTGPVHLVDSILEVFNPGISYIDYKFLNEPTISELTQEQGSFEFNDPAIFTNISWSGAKYLYYNNDPKYVDAIDNDFIFITGSFRITCTTQMIFKGEYDLNIIAHSKYSRNASVQVYLDGVIQGPPVDLTRSSSTNPYAEITVGRVRFEEYRSHEIIIEAVIPGDFSWDFTRFELVSD